MDNARTTPSVQELANYFQPKPNESIILSHDPKAENAELCWKCRALLNSDIPVGVGCSQKTPAFGGHPFRTLETTDSLEESAKRGCGLCQRLMDAISPTMRKILCNLAGQELRYSYELKTKDDRISNLDLLIRRPYDSQQLSGGHYWVTSELKLYTESELGRLMNLGPVEDHTNSKPTQELILGWLAECNTMHDQCVVERQAKPFLPTRVLDITPGQPIHLIVTSDLTTVERYTTLSHCWGTEAPLQLTHDNLAGFRAEIALTALVATFKDAIETSRLLGIYYIWIDSLCIIQNSKEDWATESSAMANIYANSYCNISAAHAAKGESGCFKRRHPASVIPLKLEVKWGVTPGWKYPLDPDLWGHNVVEAPLNSRAWVFQERTLSRRNLIFGDTEVLFECNQGKASESFPSQLPPQIKEITSRQIQIHVDGPRIRKKMELEDDPALNTITVWGDIVERYSHLQLSYVSDKLVALSAIASVLQPDIDSVYLAGMWRDHLPCQLLWHIETFPFSVNFAYATPVRPDPPLAPSWSWASMHGRVLTGLIYRSSENWKILIEIIEARVELHNPLHPFGQVKSGYIHLMGSLARSSFRKSSRYSWSLHIGSVNFLGVIFDDDKMDKHIDGQDFYLLPILHHKEDSRPPRRTPQEDYCLSGLVLCRTNLERCEYERVGKFEQIFRESTRSAWLAVAEGLRNMDVGEDKWGPRHLITLV